MDNVQAGYYGSSIFDKVCKKRGNDMRDDDFFEAVMAVGELMFWLSVLFCFCYQLFGIVDINNISFSFAGIASLLISIVFFIIPMTSIIAIVAIPASFIFAFVFMGGLTYFLFYCQVFPPQAVVISHCLLNRCPNSKAACTCIFQVQAAFYFASAFCNSCCEHTAVPSFATTTPAAALAMCMASGRL